MRFDPVTTAALLGLLSLTACEKRGTPTGEPTPPEAPAASASSAAPLPSSATSAAPHPSSASSAAPLPSSATSEAAGAAPASSAVAAVDAGKAKDGGGAAAKLEPASKHVTGNNFALDLGSPGCKAASECVMTIKLVATGDYHVNEEYPYKFVASAAPGVELLGKGDAATFSRAAGDFVTEGAKAGTMTVRFKPSAPGSARVAGLYKFSVCSADQCQIEQEKLELTVPVM
ncbi:MAG: hypothetical protein KF795_03095 [Labilithrix sp.]|nr:hypothetical protein [Labilithrix sp.]